MAIDIKLDIPDVFRPFFDENGNFRKSRYKVAYGGRGGSKTTMFAMFLVIKAMQQKLDIICARESQTVIAESVKGTIEAVIERWGIEGFWEIQRSVIIGNNGSMFRFKGLEYNRMSIKGWHNTDIVWVEEANTLSKESFDILLPTLRRPGSELWFSLNRHKRTDVVDEAFIQPKPAPIDSIIIKTNWQDNPWFPEELEKERQRCKLNEPDRYPHVWEGLPDDSPDGHVILPYAWLQECVDAHRKLEIDPVGTPHSGLDAADGGADPWGYCVRRGALIVDAWEMPGEAGDVVPVAHRHNQQHGVFRMYYDAIGVGAAVKPAIKPLAPKYRVEAYMASSSVKGPDRQFVQGVRNKDFFAKYNAQSWWNIRMRVTRTRRLLRGDEVDVSLCLFIDSSIDKLDALLLQLSQATYDRDGSNRIAINKAPSDMASPNMADAVVQAFAYDVRRGLREQ